MSISMWARPLTAEEHKHFGKSEFGKKIISSSPLSIIGCDNSPCIKSLNVKMQSYREYVGDGQYIDEVRGGGTATGGKKVPITWSRDSYQGYLLRACESLNIPVFQHPLDFNILYFESIYADAFLQVFSYVDYALSNWYNNRPALVRWFGGMAPDIGTKEEMVISNEVRRILLKAKNPTSHLKGIYSFSEEKILSVHFSASNNNYELNHVKSTVMNGYKVLFIGPETDCRNLISYGIAGVSVEKNPVLIAAQSK